MKKQQLSRMAAGAAVGLAGILLAAMLNTPHGVQAQGK